MTLQRHVLEQQIKTHHVISELTVLFALISFAAKIMAREMRRAALLGELGLVGSQNITGDAQKKLDLFANETFLHALQQSPLVAGIVSEENASLHAASSSHSARYIVCMDPFDGSSNTDVNGVGGTIIGIYRKKEGGSNHLEENLLTRSCEQVAAIYIMYGPSTILMYTSGEGVHGFTLDPSLGEFLQSHTAIQCPEQGNYLSVNTAHFHEWSSPIRQYLQAILQPEPQHSPYSHRYSGALVADFHRNLLEGGIYLYPADAIHSHGKLRYFYEAAPLAMLIEQAGGCAVTGLQAQERILDIPLTSIHQTTPLVIGSRSEVEKFEKFLDSSTGSTPLRL